MFWCGEHLRPILRWACFTIFTLCLKQISVAAGCGDSIFAGGSVMEFDNVKELLISPNISENTSLSLLLGSTDCSTVASSPLISYKIVKIVFLLE